MEMKVGVVHDNETPTVCLLFVVHYPHTLKGQNIVSNVAYIIMTFGLHLPNFRIEMNRFVPFRQLFNFCLNQLLSNSQYS